MATLPAIQKRPMRMTNRIRCAGDASRPTASPVFKIQILTSSTRLAKGSKQLKGLSPVDYYKEGGVYKYTYGESTDYNKVLRTRREISTKFKDCFNHCLQEQARRWNVNAAIPRI